MIAKVKDLNTDGSWEEWGRRDPYFAVITNPKFRRNRMTSHAKQDFFESGRWHVSFVEQTIREHIDSDFHARSVLDFGCGVGRTLIFFAQICDEATGIDVSKSMLQEAATNCRELGLLNVKFHASDDSLSGIQGSFDLIHSSIVFQHIPVDRGKVIFPSLLKRIKPGGIGAFQFLYAKSRHEATFGMAPPPPSPITTTTKENPAPDKDPEMQMNPYNMNEILFLIQRAGAVKVYAEFTDHGGELGVFLFFKLP